MALFPPLPDIAQGRCGVLGEEPGDAWLALERLLLAIADARGSALLSKRAGA